MSLTTLFSTCEYGVEFGTFSFWCHRELGEICVPKGFKSKTCLATLRSLHPELRMPACVCDENMQDPTHALRSGERFSVRVFLHRYTSIESLDSDTCTRFIRSENGVLVGAQGLGLVYQQCRGQLEPSWTYVSLDETPHLFQDPLGNHGVPYLLYRGTYGGGTHGEFGVRAWGKDINTSIGILVFTAVT